MASRGTIEADVGTATDVAGNMLLLLPGGRDRIDSLLDVINSARSTLNLYYYIFAQDECGHAILEALIDARNRGVAVTLLVDSFGSALTPKSFFSPLLDAGASFGVFGSRRSTRYLIRNHQKMTIADGKRAIIGGFNCEGGYFAQDADKKGWCDLGLRVEGPVVAKLEDWYARIAAWTLSETQSFRDLRAIVREWNPGEGSAVWLMGGPTRRLNAWAKCVKLDLERADRLDMVAAYFSPGHGMLRRINLIARCGEVRLILARYSDNSATIGAARHLYRRMLRAGVAIFEYLPCKLHMKLIAVDDVCYIGSANFDKRSLFLNLEVMLRIDDAAFAKAVRALIDRLEGQCAPIDKTAYKKIAGPLSRIWWWFDFLLVGVLDYTVTRRLNFRREQR